MGVSAKARVIPAAYLIGVNPKACNFGKITEGREGEDVLVVDCVGQFARVKGRRDPVAHWPVERLGKKKVFTPLWIQGGEIPQLVLLNRAADIEPGVHLGEAARRSVRKGKVPGPAYESLRREIAKNIAMEIVASALDYNVEDAAC